MASRINSTVIRILMLSLVLGWCGGAGQFHAQAASRGTGIIFAQTTPSISTLPIEIATRQGYFRNEGLEVTFILLKAQTVIRALVAGSANYATSIGSVIRGATNGLPIKAAGVILGRPDYMLITKGEITSMQALKGKTIGVSDFGGSSDVAIRHVLKKNGLDPEKDVTIIVIGGSSSRFAALRAGSVDATVLVVPFNLEAKKLGFNNLLWLAEVMEMPMSGLGVTDKEIRDNPQQIVKILKAIDRGIIYAKANREEAIRVEMDWMKVGREAAESGYDLIRNAWADFNIISDAVIENEVEQARQRLKIKTPVPLSQVRDWRFAEQAKRELQAEKPR